MRGVSCHACDGRSRVYTRVLQAQKRRQLKLKPDTDADWRRVLKTTLLAVRVCVDVVWRDE
jgi:hypothetical protein